MRLVKVALLVDHDSVIIIQVVFGRLLRFNFLRFWRALEPLL